MPRLNGLELILRTWESGINLPAVVMTGICDTDIHNEIKALEVKAVLRKPFRRNEMLQHIDAVFENSNHQLSIENHPITCRAA